MMLGAIGTGAMPKAVFGLCERISAFSAVVFNAVPGVYLLTGKFGEYTKRNQCAEKQL
jgi:hypothetical protein